MDGMYITNAVRVGTRRSEGFERDAEAWKAWLVAKYVAN